MTRHEATQRQIDAAMPNRSTWVSANAGSGKTKVLIDRVTQLLLAGTDPQNILCLTFTKAAATEMQNRLFKHLGSWAMLPEKELRSTLEKLGLNLGLGAGNLAQARRLFALAIETPGGIKIQTIHSFCSALLRRFPLEAGISPQFKEMEDRATRLLRGEIIEQIALDETATLLEDLAETYGGESLQELTENLVKSRSAFPNDLNETDISAALDLNPDDNWETLINRVFQGGEQNLIDRLVAAMQSGSTTDQKNATHLSRLPDLSDCSKVTELTSTALPILEGVFLTKKSKEPFSAKIDTVPTKNIRESHPDLVDELNAFMLRIEQARPLRLSLELRHRTLVLHRFARVFLDRYAEAKAARGLLDFDDLILVAMRLLNNPEVADWVLYKLDGQIDHILIDEAQDTSPNQWRLIEGLAREIISGQGARPDINRTVFVVGDKKQSIYSFQGADPAEFDRMKAAFRERLSGTKSELQDLEMAYSFRSGEAILSIVDATFSGRHASGFNQREPHKAFKTDLPSRVDLWPLQEKVDEAEQSPWYLPVDRCKPDDPPSLLARKIVSQIQSMIGTPLPSERGEARPIGPGDFLILVRTRSSIFKEIIRQCKEANLPVAGADRLKVGAELAVRDVGALMAFLATPEDDLSLAVSLRSPLFGWSEQDLFSLAHGRKQKFLWAELRNKAEDHPQTLEILNDLRSAADFLRPYDMIERILTRHGGRERLLARLGPEAEDGIDALLDQAMAYEKSAVDSLTGFQVWLETDEPEIKRQFAESENLIRVMTIHGAKGLQAPIVILPDCAKVTPKDREKLLLRNDLALLKPVKSNLPPTLQTQTAQKEATEKAERDRLLYVGMTRAEQWLIVAAAGEIDGGGSDWHSMVRQGLADCPSIPLVTPLGPGLRYQNGDWPDGTLNHDAKPIETIPLEPFFSKPAPRRVASNVTLSPSDLSGPKALPGEEGLDEEDAKKRGRQIHKLLEELPRLPPSQWADASAEILSSGVDGAQANELEGLLAEVREVLTAPALEALFHPDALVEVPVSANLPALGGQRMHGVIDRLVIGANNVLAVDFKTNALIPRSPEECPEGLLRQMGAYLAGLEQIFPERSVGTAFVWTRKAELMHLPNDLVTTALSNAAFP